MTNICNFCLKLSDTCNSIDESFKETVKLLFNNVEFLIAECSLICKECIQRVHLACDLKAASISNEDFILSCETNKPTHGKLIDVYLKKNKVKYDVLLSELKVCRFCITVVPDNNFYLLKDIEVNMNIREILTKHFPEVDFTIANNPIVCKTCLRKLQDYGMFINSWLEVYNLKKTYCVCNNKSEISDLNEIRKFIFDTNIVPQHFDNSDIHIIDIKQEIVTQKFENGLEDDEKINDYMENNIHLKNELHDELQYATEGDHIKIESGSSDVQLGNNVLYRNDDFEIEEPKPKIEIEHFEPQMEPHFEPQMESDDYVLREEKISISHIIDEDAIKIEEYSERDSETPSLCSNNQEMSFCREAFVKMKQKRLNLAKKSIKQRLESRNSTFQIIKINDGFRCGLCPFQNQLEAQVRAHFKNYHNSKNSRQIPDEIVDEKNSDKIAKQFGVQLFKCLHCDFKSKYKGNLKDHLKIHFRVKKQSAGCPLNKCLHRFNMGDENHIGSNSNSYKRKNYEEERNVDDESVDTREANTEPDKQERAKRLARERMRRYRENKKNRELLNGANEKKTEESELANDVNVQKNEGNEELIKRKREKSRIYSKNYRKKIKSQKCELMEKTREERIERKKVLQRINSKNYRDKVRAECLIRKKNVINNSQNEGSSLSDKRAVSRTQNKMHDLDEYVNMINNSENRKLQNKNQSIEIRKDSNSKNVLNETISHNNAPNDKIAEKNL